MTFPSPFAAASKMCLSFIFRTWQKKKKKKNTRKRKPKIPFIVLAQKLRGRERTGCLVNEKVSGLEI